MLIVVAMSGGVDSSVAAAVLRREGHEVIGITMQIWPDEGLENAERRGGCCGFGAVRDARAVAELLGIPYYVFQMRDAFERHVIAQFASAYAHGRTPNPCVACNEHIKFGALLDKARRLGAGALATGHYARRVQGSDGDWRLARATDPRKDQSYVLHPIRAEDLAFVRFPVGNWSKERTRQEARALGLGVSDKPDSQEICFVGAGGYAEIVGMRHPKALDAGPIRDASGRVIGYHRGLAHYTVGQRKGLGLESSEPLFVLEIDVEDNAIVVGTAAEVHAASCDVDQMHWLVPDLPEDGTEVSVKVRSGPAEHPARVVHRGLGVRLEFLSAVRAVTPGQSAVLYCGDIVLGGGPIDRVQRSNCASLVG